MKRMTPMLHISTAGEYSLMPSPTPSTSGATYWGEPHIVDKTVSGEKNLDKPKSAILTGESSRSFCKIMFSSFKSRCTMPVGGGGGGKMKLTIRGVVLTTCRKNAAERPLGQRGKNLKTSFARKHIFATTGANQPPTWA